jgi:hypothetical protein
VFLLTRNDLLKKSAIPGTGNSESSIPLTMIVLFALIFATICKNVLRVDAGRLRLPGFLMFRFSQLASSEQPLSIDTS